MRSAGRCASCHVRTASANVLRVAIPAFPGWHARLNGVELTTLSVDTAFQGVLVPAGEGDLRLEYTPRYFSIGALISSLALGACAAVLGRTFAYEVLQAVTPLDEAPLQQAPPGFPPGPTRSARTDTLAAHAAHRCPGNRHLPHSHSGHFAASGRYAPVTERA